VSFELHSTENFDNVIITDTLSDNVKLAPGLSPKSLLSDLSRVRLAEVARLYGVALPEKSREEQVTHFLHTVDVKFGTLLGRLTREELRRACRIQGLSDNARSRAELANSLLEVFSGDAGDHWVTGLFAASLSAREAPEVGDVILLRHRQWLVEEVVPPPDPNQLTLVKGVCLDDDNQGTSPLALINARRDYQKSYGALITINLSFNSITNTPDEIAMGHKIWFESISKCDVISVTSNAPSFTPLIDIMRHYGWNYDLIARASAACNDSRGVTIVQSVTPTLVLVPATKGRGNTDDIMFDYPAKSLDEFTSPLG